MHKLKSITLLLFLAASLASGCQVLDDSSYQTTRGFELLKQKKYSQAEAIFQQSVLTQENRYLELKTANGGKANKPEAEQAKRLAHAQNNLATAYYQSGKYGLAEDVLEKAIDLFRTYFGRENPFVANASGMLAASYFKQGKLLEAERFYHEELEIKKILLKPDSLELARISNNLASIYQQLGEDDEAEKYFQWALNLCKNAKPTTVEMDQYADILNNLALFYEKQEYYGEARDTVNQALDIEDKQKGEAFIVDKVRSLLVLASIEKSTFELEESEEHYKEALELIDSELGGNPDLSSDTLAKYAELLMDERKFKEAEPVLARCLRDAEKAHGHDHPHVAEALSDSAHLERHFGRLDRAEELLKRALAIQEGTIGIDTNDYLATVYRLASLYSELNRDAEADKLYQEVVPKLKARLGPDHPFVADTLDNWSVFVDKIGKPGRSKELRDQARLIRRKMARSLYQ